MQFDLNDLLQAIGPTASLVFAAWIFLSFLQARYVAAFERYRELANDYRNSKAGARHDSIYRQILLYRRRCEWMRLATNLGVASAILLIVTLIMAAANVVSPGHAFIPPLAAASSISGLLLVTAGAAAVIVENNLVGKALAEELHDIPEFQRGSETSRRDRMPTSMENGG